MLLSTIVFCQTNRHTEMSVSKYKSSTNTNNGYYYSPERLREIAKQKSEQVLERAAYYYEKMEDLHSDTPYEKVTDVLEDCFSYLDPILDKKPMNLYEAEWRVKKAIKRYKKAIRVHNRLVKRENRK